MRSALFGHGLNAASSPPSFFGPQVLHEDATLPDAWDRYEGKAPLRPLSAPLDGGSGAPSTSEPSPEAAGSESYAASYWTQFSLLTVRSACVKALGADWMSASRVKR